MGTDKDEEIRWKIPNVFDLQRFKQQDDQFKNAFNGWQVGATQQLDDTSSSGYSSVATLVKNGQDYDDYGNIKITISSVK